MLKAMTKMQLGLLDPQLFKRAECTKKIFELQSTELYTIEQTEYSGITALDLSLDGKFLLVGGVSGINYVYRTYEQNRSTQMEVTMPMICKTKQFHAKFVTRAQWHPVDTDMYSSSSRDGSLALWFGEMAKVPVVHYGNSKTAGKEGYHCHHMNPQEPRLIAAAATSAGSPNGFHIIDLRLNGPSLRIPEVHPTRGAVRDGSEIQEVRWHSNSAYTLAVGSLNGYLYEWDVRSSAGPIVSYGSSETTEEFFQGHTGMISSIRYAKNGSELYSLGLDHYLKKWSTASGNLLDSLSFNSHRQKSTGPSGGRNEGNVMAYFKSSIYHPTFCITEATEPAFAFLAGEITWVTVDLRSMCSVRHIPSNVIQYGQNNTCVYDDQNHLLYTGGSVLTVYGSTEAYSEYCAEVLGRFVQTPLLIDMVSPQHSSPL